MSLLGDLSFNYNSLNLVCNDSKQVMVYGASHCGWIELIKSLNFKIDENPIKLVFTYSLGNSNTSKTLEKRKIDKMPTEPSNGNEALHTSRMCKAALVNLVYENYKRVKKGLPLIPVIFSVDINNNKFPLDSNNLTSRDPEVNHILTYKELRRSYKLCSDTDIPIELRNIAQKTFKFVKISYNEI